MKKFICFFLLLLTFELSIAQPVVANIYKNKLPLLAGKFITLPQGEWKLTYTTSIQEKGEKFKWNAYVFKNTITETSIPFMVVRMSDLPVPWSGETACTSTTPFPGRYLVNTYGTNKNSLISKCTAAWRIRPFPEWLEYKPKTNDIWWKDTVKGLEDGKSFKSLLNIEESILVYKQYGVAVSLFITPPEGLTGDEFIQGFKDGNESKQTSAHQQLSLWSALYLEALEQSFVHNQSNTLIGLNMPKAHVNSQAINKINVENSLKKGDTPTSAAINSSAQTSTIAESQFKTIKEDNQRLESQLNQLREMLEQLKKTNERNTQKADEQNQDSSSSEIRKPQIFANRKALVIGNDTYKSVPKLLNAREDARTIAANLTAVGYQVTLKLDLDEKEMKTALRIFAEQVQGGDEVLFFFAGHGVQLGATNYLLPIDLAGNSEAQVRDEAIQLQRVLDDMSDRKAKFTLAMIDACRDNPFKSSGRAIGGRGLAPTTAATGQMVIFSAGTGQQALDKLGNNDKNKNGLFTRVFVQEMQKPSLSVDRVVKNVRNKVAELAKTVGHEQVPAIYDQVLGDFYFKK
jgi:hypothetical protein